MKEICTHMYSILMYVVIEFRIDYLCFHMVTHGSAPFNTTGHMGWITSYGREDNNLDDNGAFPIALIL